ncbi:MAG: isoprenylcysteine carboxylmethyltransferase family protein, partial [Lysobacterales bacterium]
GLVPFSPATTLVTGGLYRYTRNPMYLGMTLMLLGMALLLGSVTALAPVAGFARVIHKRFVLPEEAFLEKAFGQAYLDYKLRVRRWL